MCHTSTMLEKRTQKGQEIEILKVFELCLKERFACLPRAVRRQLSDAEADTETRKWEKRSSDMAPNEANRELECQRLELYQAHQWADQAQKERINLCGDL